MVTILILLWPAASSEEPRPSGAVMARARALELWNDRAWLALVHYRSDLFGGVASAVDGAEFFLSPEGESNPRAELEATLAAFYRPLTGAADSHPRCRFPARLHWLDQQLHFVRALPQLRCPKLERHQASKTPASVALVYAGNSLDSPVTAFGHTLLLFRRRGEATQNDIVVEYTAETGSENPLLYAYKGVFGLFRGRYYYHGASAKLSWYLEEGRDLWEYELRLTRAERKQLTRHLWELSATYFDYYYATENCSYGVLVLLEGAIPRLALLGETKFVVPPVDTVKALFGSPGLVRAIHHRSARRKNSVPLLEQAPHRGHGSMRVVLGTGFTTQYDDGFATLGYRMALHDLADPPLGQPGLAQVQFLRVRARYEALRRRVTLNELTFAEMFALQPLRLGFEPSWRFRAHGLRLRDAGCESDDCFAHGLNGALGLSLATPDERVTGFVMADVLVLYSAELDGIGGSAFRAGLGPYAGIRVNAAGKLVGLLSGTWSYLPRQTLSHSYAVEAALRASVAGDVALGVEALLQPAASEVQLLSYLYF